MKICITGSTGLIGSVAAQYFLGKKHQVVGIDNNMRSKFFGTNAATTLTKKSLKKYPNYTHLNLDIRSAAKINELFENQKFDAIIHCAGQPSHDRAAQIPLLDFEVNTLGTLTLLEATRHHCPQAVFIFTSTNKVYGDNPNRLSLKELEKRYMYRDKNFKGVAENMSIDQNLHSLMGVSKASADLYVQEYGLNFGLKTTCLRLGCVTGAAHHSVKLHGFLSYLIKSLVHHNSYQIIGFKGKQVRDQLDAFDVATAMAEILKKPPKGEVFNLGGGLKNNASILELIELVSQKLTSNPKITYLPQPRTGDHICYITDLTKFKRTYPKWKITKSLEKIIDEIIAHEKNL
jgi:CDP-paratose 2-epimerase